MTADRSPDLLALLYEAAADGEETSLLVALGALGDAFACKVVHLVGSDASTGMPLWDAMADSTGGALRDGARDYVAHHWRTDPRRRVMPRLQPGAAFACHELLGDREIDHNEFYQDFFLPRGLRYSLITRLPDTRLGLVDLVLVRSPDGQPFDAAAKRRLLALSPHVSRALLLRSRLAQARDSQALLVSQGSALLWLDAAFNVRQCGPGSAWALAAVDHTLRRDAALLPLLRLVLADGRARAHPLLSPSARRLWMTALRAQGGGVVLLVQDPAAREPPAPEVLRVLLKLTVAESRIANLLQQGLPPQACAQRLGVSASTVRTHLRALFAKTGTHSQGDLQRLLAPLHGVT